METSQDLPRRRVLVVDDEEALLRAQVRILTNAGYDVESALSGTTALLALEGPPFDVILTDIDMPGLNGIEFLERIRTRDLDVAVVMITGNPSVETAMRAMELGAIRYVVKPVASKDLVKLADDAVRLRRLAKAKRQALELAGGADRFFGDRAGLAGSFGRAMETLYIAYQPIVAWSTRTVYAYEALMRTREPSLPHPGAVLDAAERLERVHDLGRRIRLKAIEPCERLAGDALLFLNLHPADVLVEELFRTEGPLVEIAKRVVLEITERASLVGMRDVRTRIASLRKLGFRIAVDDLGAGYAGLTSFTLLEPDIVKLDMALVRDVDKEPKKQTVVKTMVSMCKELGIIVTAEGVETSEERDVLERAGCDLMQGYLFAKPGDAFPVPTF